MILQLIKSRRKQILIDIDTQKDFLLAEGKACIRNHRRVLAHIRRVMAWARSQHVPIISTAEVYPNNNGEDNVGYCIDGTEGQKKIPYTLFKDRISFAADGSTDLPRDMLRQHRQIILHKRCVDPFDEPRIDRLLSEVRANEFILVGASLEGAVKMTALGLLQRGKKVTIIVDAVLRGRNRVMSASTVLKGEYGLSNISIGVPVILGENGVERIIELKLGSEVEKQFRMSVSTIKDSMNKLEKI